MLKRNVLLFSQGFTGKLSAGKDGIFDRHLPIATTKVAYGTVNTQHSTTTTKHTPHIDSDHMPMFIPFVLDPRDQVLLPMAALEAHLFSYVQPTHLFWLIVFNMMMCGKYNEIKNRFNTGHRLIEDPQDDYHSRMWRHGNRVQDWTQDLISSGDTVLGAFFQEGPINDGSIDLLQKGLGKADLHIKASTGHGLISAWSDNALQSLPSFKNFQSQGSVYGGKYAKFNDRHSTFQVTANSKLTNLHLDHDGAVPQLELLLTIIRQDIIDSLNAGGIVHSHILLGDFNLPKDVIEQAIAQSLRDLFHGLVPLVWYLSYHSSHNGHLKAVQNHNTEFETMTVDHCLTLYYRVLDHNLLANILHAEEVLSGVDAAVATADCHRVKPC